MTRPNTLKTKIIDLLLIQHDPTQPKSWVNQTHEQLCDIQKVVLALVATGFHDRLCTVSRVSS